LTDRARELIAQATQEEREARQVIRRVPRKPYQRIADPKTHPDRWVLFTVAAEFLEMDRRALEAYVDEGDVAWEWKGRRRKIHIDEVVRFKAALKARPARAS
jgi:hypothetical protein